jgi:hypothetical protein
MAGRTKYYEIYGELVKNKIFLQRLIAGLIGLNLVLIVLCYIGFTRPGQTFVIKDGYAFSANPYEFERSVHEVRKFCYEFSKNLLEFNRDTFNEHIKSALQMCTQELEYIMYNTIRNSDIPKVVQSTPGTIRFEVKEILIKEGDPFKARVSGQQLFPGQAPLDIVFDLDINIVSRSEKNPFGLQIINFQQL